MSHHSDLQTSIDEINRLMSANPGMLPAKVYGIDLGGDLTFVLDGPNNTLIQKELPKGGCDCLISTDIKSLQTLLTDAKAAGLLVWTGKIRLTHPKAAVELALALQSLRRSPS